MKSLLSVARETRLVRVTALVNAFVRSTLRKEEDGFSK